MWTLFHVLCANPIGVRCRYELAAVKPDWLLVAKGLIPNPVILKNPEMLYVAIGILGEQVLHNTWAVQESKGRQQEIWARSGLACVAIYASRV